VNGFVVVASIVVMGLIALRIGLLSDRAADITRVVIALPATVYFAAIAATGSGNQILYALLFAVFALVILFRATRNLIDPNTGSVDGRD